MKKLVLILGLLFSVCVFAQQIYYCPQSITCPTTDANDCTFDNQNGLWRMDKENTTAKVAFGVFSLDSLQIYNKISFNKVNVICEYHPTDDVVWGRVWLYATKEMRGNMSNQNWHYSNAAHTTSWCIHNNINNCPLLMFVKVD